MKKTIRINQQNCLTNICQFAISFREDKTHTPRELYRNTGYDKYYADLTQESIITKIKAHPDVVDAWLAFSEDKRWSPAWFLEKRSEKSWRVAYIVKGGGIAYEITFTDRFSACALMVRMEMEEFRMLNPK